MDEQKSDPSIVNRLNDMPPYLDEAGNAVETPVEETTEETPVETKEEVTEDVALDNSKNPERTKEFIDKLKEENETLRQQAKREMLLPSDPPSYDLPELPSFSPVTNEKPIAQEYPHLTQREINKTVKELNLFDEEGYVDKGLLTETFNNLEERAKRAEEEAKSAKETAVKISQRYDTDKLEKVRREVHNKYPQLDPDRRDVNFDSELWEKVKDEMILQQVKGEGLVKGGGPDFLSAADKVYNQLYPEMNKQVKEKADAMRNINAMGTKASSTNRATSTEIESMSQAMRKGKKGALADRLKASGY